MFTDKRSKKIVVVSHCILNQNSISDSTADFRGTFEPLVNLLIESEVGIIQMPCPELLCLGLDRSDIHGAERPVVVENTRIRNALNRSSKKKIKQLAAQVIFQIEEYIKHDFSIVGIIGLDRSPSCGVNTTSMNNEEVEGKGIFMQTLMDELSGKGIDIEFVGVKTSQIDKSLAKVEKLLNKE
ncbi:MAG: CD3072 family TudS-related putative desulfidase [Thermoplasmatota archaeon]